MILVCVAKICRLFTCQGVVQQKIGFSMPRCCAGNVGLLLCEDFMQSQCKGLQDMMAKQEKSPKSSNLVLACIDLFSSAQPLLGDALLKNEGNLSLCFMQCTFTLMETIRGMHLVNVRELLSSETLATVNRSVFMSDPYVKIASHPQDFSR